MKQRAFSLVELSIVLVILGLLVGGVLGGQSLIKAAQLRSVTTDLNKFQTALNAFLGKYNAMPGDLANATDYWGVASGGCPGGARTGTQTCNGTGDGVVVAFGGVGNTYGTGATQYEAALSWQHLSNAGLIEGTYSGAGGHSSTIGVNVPASKINGVGYTFYYLGPISGHGWYRAGNHGHAFVVGGYYFGYPTLNYAIPAEDAQALDRKVDDGMPAGGSVTAIVGDVPTNCSDGATPEKYPVAAATTCALVFKFGTLMPG